MSGPIYTPVAEIQQVREHLEESFRAGKAKPIAYRKEQLLRLAYLFQDNLKPFQEALRSDLGRPVIESNIFDLSVIINECLLAYKKLDSWVKPERGSFELKWFALSPKLHKEPKGTVLIIAPWNFPLICLAPLAGAIAAGCAAMVKPSELAPATAQLLTELFPIYMDNDLYRVVNGGVEETTKLLSLQWDHILYTGNARVGSIVATAAAKHLTPVTLELGGKSPAIVDENADFELAAKRILWGKMTNAGQVCCTPDYVLVPESCQEKLVDAFKKCWAKFYGTDALTKNSIARICTPGHWERIVGLLKDTHGEIVLGGETDRADKYIAPTVVQDVSFTDSLMSEEIFGPVLPIVPVPDIHAALAYVNSHDHPLALYVFSKDAKLRDYVRNHTLSGQFMGNDCNIHGGASMLPFGGVGKSGYGSHKGKYSFDTFTHQRASFNSPKWIDFIMGFRYPPYTEKNLQKAKAVLMAPIPYARPGQSRSLNWKRWIVSTLTLGTNRQHITEFIKA